VWRIYENIAGGAQPDYVVRKASEIYEHAGENIRKAWLAGVRSPAASDAGTPYNRHQDYAYEVELMSTVLGMSPQQALTAATATAAQLLGVDAGVLAAGRPADLLLLDRDVGADVRALREAARRDQGRRGRARARLIDLRGLRIAVLGAISWRTPPPGYGPWEQVAYNIARGLVQRGADVTLFATADSSSPGKLAAVVPVGLNDDPALNAELCTELHVASCFAARASST